MDVLNRLKENGIVPVVVLEDASNAVPAAKALLAGEIDVMEITLRTKAGLDSIKAVSQNCPDMLVGAGTVITLEQTKQCVGAGAKFIVSPGFNREQVKWCVENNVPITPGCVTPTEIMEAMSFGLKVLKFFPANIYGGLSAMKALSGPFGDIKFIPTGGVNTQNIAEFASASYVHAVGGSWICPKADISAGNFEKITSLCQEAKKQLLGFEIAHVGMNMKDAEASDLLMKKLNAAFGFDCKPGNGSNFAGSAIEIMKQMYLGANGHLAVRTNDISRASAYLEKKGYAIDADTCKYKGDKLIAVYLKDSFGDFAVHLLQK